MADWPQHVRWLTDPFGLLVGPLLGLGLWLAEGSSSRRKPSLAAGSADDLVWEKNYWLNRLLLAILYGSSVTVMIGSYFVGQIRGPIDIAGAFLCGFLTWPIGFLLIARRDATTRYKEFRRFSYLRYGYNAASILLVSFTSVLALVWMAYVAMRV
jgi:hypothetical protein